MDVTLTSVEDIGGDRLLIKAVIEDGKGKGYEAEATGWVSATTNHFDPSAYDANKARKANQTPRAMTKAEVAAYCEARVRESEGITADPVKVAGVVDDAAAAQALDRIKPVAEEAAQDVKP